MYPIAWALVDKETNETWDWFVSLLCSDLKLGDGSDYVIISDQQKGILKAVENWLPRAEHRNCARHLYANWRKTYREKEWQKLFWACAKASSPMLFNLARAKLAQETVEGARDVMKTDPHHWSRAWFRLGSNCDSVDSNICESFNKWIVEPRCLPAISMFEAIRVKIMARIEYQRTESDKWTGTICPTVLRKLKKSINASAYCHAVWNGEDLYEVTHREHRFQVNLEEWTCSCRYWQLSGLPCPHAISCIFFKTNNIDDYIDKCYSIEAFKKTYAFCLQPVEGRPAWPVSERPRPNPPGEITMPGRKKKQRTREQQEKPRCATRVSKRGTKIRCSMCKLHGHNRTSCKARNGTGSSNTPTPKQGQGPARSKAPSAASKQPATSQTATSSQAPCASQGPDMPSRQSSTRQSKRKATEEVAAPNPKRRAPTGSSSRSNNFSGNTINVQRSSNVNVNVSTGNSSARASSRVVKHTKKYAGFRRLLGLQS
ncbi:uncharacterized protein LOC119353223 isoform X1 [Triticum dicoccoides]|uniref:uncharacterized protein LOC119353223 isoform X1 n=1 Tax=Triticum dicoccoides TaxID=85692 RepID=UPI0018906A98|nr:uncharacterized protein LOC119353223 isoform X1 [Triticum dicoccoides]